MKLIRMPLAIVAITVMTSTGALAASCGNTSAGFGPWLERFKREAVSNGISTRAVSSALSGVTYNSTVIRLDRNQKSFKLSFNQFWKRRVNNAMINRGKRLMKTHGSVLSRIEKKYGVPPSVIVAIWGLETGYGANSGKMDIFRSLATLAYDCRRSAFFKNELMSALKIVHRGDMSPKQMRGAWAGEIGQTQFLASSYIKYAVSFDGNRRRDLIRSVPDVLASTANYLRAYGWKRGKGFGPGQPNYPVIKQWNRAGVYVKTISRMAQMLDGR